MNCEIKEIGGKIEGIGVERITTSLTPVKITFGTFESGFSFELSNEEAVELFEQLSNVLEQVNPPATIARQQPRRNNGF